MGTEATTDTLEAMSRRTTPPVTDALAVILDALGTTIDELFVESPKHYDAPIVILVMSSLGYEDKVTRQGVRDLGGSITGTMFDELWYAGLYQWRTMKSKKALYETLMKTVSYELEWVFNQPTQ